MTTPGHLFAYGTLMHPAVFEQVIGYRMHASEAILEDYARRRLVDRSYPAIVAAPGERVTGCLYRDLSESTWRKLDAFEGSIYERRTVVVTLESGRREKAQSYILGREHSSSLTSQPWSYRRFVARDLERFIGDYEGFRSGEQVNR